MKTTHSDRGLPSKDVLLLFSVVVVVVVVVNDVCNNKIS